MLRNRRLGFRLWQRPLARVCDVDGRLLEGRLLCGGFWGISRHVNYLGEIVQGLALALPGYLASGSLLPFLYPVYYIALFVGRERDDHVACKEKYGTAWDAYCRLVPYRIVPGVY